MRPSQVAVMEGSGMDIGKGEPVLDGLWDKGMIT